MITFFTTAKEFSGPTADSQLNAIRSWLALHKECEVIIFEEPKGIDIAALDSRIRVVKEVERDFDVPRIDFMFDYASTNASNEIVCFINCDIVVTSEFTEAIRLLFAKKKKKFLAVGQRWDFENESGEWKFDDQWETRYLQGITKTLHPASGSDYFLFPRGQYNKRLMVPLLVGRPGWDLWMIYNARKRKIAVVDLSPSCYIYHQNHDYSHKKKQYASNLDEPEAKRNLSFLPAKGQFDFTLLACDYELSPSGQLEATCSRGNAVAYFRIQELLEKNKLMSRLRFRQMLNAKQKKADAIKRALGNRAEMQKFISTYHNRDDLRFDIGSSKFNITSRWIKTDIDTLNLTRANEWQEILGSLKLSNVFAEHVWEHLTPEQGDAGNKNIFNHLKKGGRFRVAVPDGYMPDPTYIDYVKPGGNGAGADDHKLLYNYSIMKAALEKVGFKVELLEYWDENGKFHFTDWNTEHGKVLRSRRFDKRNESGELKYTSLIVDAIKS